MPGGTLENLRRFTEFHADRNTRRSKINVRLNKVICARMLLGFGSKVMRRVNIVMTKPANIDSICCTFDMIEIMFP